MLLNLKKDWQEINKTLLSFAAFILSLTFSYPAAAGDNIQRMTYSVYAGGINAVEASMEMDLSIKDRYDVSTEAHTRGFLGTLVPWSSTFDSYGWLTENEANPYQVEMHKSAAMWRGKNKIKEYKYNKDGSFEGLFITEHDKPTEKKEPDQALTKDSTDVITATLQALHQIAQGGSCDSQSAVFDGKRRFDMIIKQKKEEHLDASRYNIYEGNAQRCTVEVKPDGGAWHKKPRGWFSIQEQGREKGTMPTIWFGTMAEGEPAIPVKVMVKTNYGALMMHLIGYEYGDTKIVLKD